MPRRSSGSFLAHLHPVTIPERAARIGFTWCLGGVAVWTFIIEAVTGALLAFQFLPSSSAAYRSIGEISTVVPYGFFLRNLHYWTGQLMVALVVLHAVRVVVTGSYARPRQFNWLVGLALLAATILVDFTGYLLVWDVRAVQALTIARNLLESVPLLGSAAASLLFGPPEAGDLAVVRLYAWHAIFLPVLISALMAWHFWRIRKDGGISLPL